MYRTSSDAEDVITVKAAVGKNRGLLRKSQKNKLPYTPRLLQPNSPGFGNLSVSWDRLSSTAVLDSSHLFWLNLIARKGMVGPTIAGPDRSSLHDATCDNGYLAGLAGNIFRCTGICRPCQVVRPDEPLSHSMDTYGCSADLQSLRLFVLPVRVRPLRGLCGVWRSGDVPITSAGVLSWWGGLR